KALVIPVTRRMPAATLEKLLDLVQKGAKVVLQAMPEDVPGFGDYAGRHDLFVKLRNQLQQQRHVVIGADIVAALQSHGIRGELMVQQGLPFIRRSTPEGTYYFTVNHGADAIDEWVPFQAATRGEALLLDPQTRAEERRVGKEWRRRW